MTAWKPTRSEALGAVSALLAAGATSVGAQTLTTIRYGATPSVDSVPIFYAQSNGFFRAAGIDLQVQRLSGPAIPPALLAGSLDVGGVDAISLINGHVRGLDLEIIYPTVIHITGRPYPGAVIVATDSPYHSGRDLNGKTIAVPSIGAAAWIAERLSLDATGGDSSTVRFLEVPLPAVVAAIEAHRVDAGFSVQPFLSQAVKSGKERSLGDVDAALGPRSIQNAYTARSGYIAQNGNVLSRFVRVMKVAHTHMNDNRADLAAWTQTYSGIPVANQAPDAVTFATTSVPHELQPWISAAAKYGVIPRSFDATELFGDLAEGPK